MLQALSTCAINHETTGAAVVAWVFMGIFAVLIIGDAVATGFALAHAVNRDAEALKKNAGLRAAVEAQLQRSPKTLREVGRSNTMAQYRF
jgi:hypothetical protein